MNLYSIPGRMDYIQNVFLGVQVYMQQERELTDLITFLDTEASEFRSVAYESASMEIALQELRKDKTLDTWQKFYESAANAHTFHIDIGLGWAFAKSDISPSVYMPSFGAAKSRMIFDGVGYYHALFKGRKTVKSQSIPDGIQGEELHGFDQGVGRRLWYISKGEVNQLIQLLHSFNYSRHADLWRGVGIACGYVGGSDKNILEQLLISSSEFKKQLCAGIILAAVSRRASNSISEDINLACNIICGKSLDSVLSDKDGLLQKFDRELKITI